MPLPAGRLSPPASVDDFSRRPAIRDAFAAGWDAVVGSWFQSSAGREGGAFYDFRTDTDPAPPASQAVPWDAFPRGWEKWFEDDDDPDGRRWLAADTLAPRRFDGKDLRRVEDGSLAEPVPVYYRQQDEYCEWFVSRSPADPGRIDRVTFTSEGPEYWRFLAMGTRPFFPEFDDRHGIVDGDLGLVVDLYRQHVDPSVEPDDLVWPFDVAAWDGARQRWYVYGRAGGYNPFNRWNTTHGAMHLTHPANTLRGEFTVASRAAVLRRDALGRPVDDTEDLVCCSGFGDPNRSSDPAIGGGVNGLVAQGLSVSLADPVGVYIAGINLDAFNGPAGEDVSGAWVVTRGDAGRRMILRATFSVPDGLDFTLDQVRACGEPVAFGGQVADEVQMVLTGLAKDRGITPQPPQPCVTKCCRHPGRPGIETVVEPDDDCAAFDWSTIEPLMPPAPSAVESPVTRAAAPPGPDRDPTRGAAVVDDGPVSGAVPFRR